MNRELLNNQERIEYPAKLFGVHFPFRLEPYVYDTAGRLSADYNGGYWLMYRLDNGGFYMAPDEETFQGKRLIRYFQRIPHEFHSVQVPGEQDLVSGQGVHPGQLVEDMTEITVGLATIGFGGLDQRV